MKKERYERVELEIVEFVESDVIMTSPVTSDPDELPFVPAN